MNRYLKILLIIWELPQTVLVAIIIFFSRRKITGRGTYKNVDINYVKNFPGGISLGRFIILNDKYSGHEFSIKHEYGHSNQSLYLGWLYLLVVGLPSITRAILWRTLKLDRSGYYRGYPENWANKLGFSREEYLKILEKL
ncbi:MAG: hypothetical protein K8S14_00480 [Actinomycetia bacterium]|nr:hypothetical protein [Actinomycetes bacterium]